MSDADLDELVARLEATAADLRSQALSPADAAQLVDECARLALAAGTAADRLVSAGDEGAPGQLPLG